MNFLCIFWTIISHIYYTERKRERVNRNTNYTVCKCVTLTLNTLNLVLPSNLMTNIEKTKNIHMLYCYRV